MEPTERLLRLWTGLTALAILVAAAIVAALFLQRSWSYEESATALQRRLIERQVLTEYAALAESLRGPASAIEDRRHLLQSLLGAAGEVTLVFERRVKALDGSEGNVLLSWEESATQSIMSLPIRTEELELGTLHAAITWEPGWSLGGRRRVLLATGAAALVMAVGFVGLFFGLGRRLLARAA